MSFRATLADMKKDALDVSRWDLLGQGEQEGICREVATTLGQVRFCQMETCHSPHASPATRNIGRFEYQGDGETLSMMLIPGGQIELGLCGEIRETLKRIAPSASFDKFDADGVIKNFQDEPERAGGSFSDKRRVVLPAFLVERETQSFASFVQDEDDDEEDVLGAICAGPLGLPSLDQWEYLYSGGCRSFFPWGDTWPEPGFVSAANLFGLRFTSDHECTSSYLQLGGGDPSGWSLNSYDGAIVRASSYAPHRSHIANFVWEAYESAGVRRILEI